MIPQSLKQISMHILIFVANGRKDVKYLKDVELMQESMNVLLSGLTVSYMTPSTSSSSAEKNKREKGKKKLMNYAPVYLRATWQPACSITLKSGI